MGGYGGWDKVSGHGKEWKEWGKVGKSGVGRGTVGATAPETENRVSEQNAEREKGRGRKSGLSGSASDDLRVLRWRANESPGARQTQARIKTENGNSGEERVGTGGV